MIDYARLKLEVETREGNDQEKADALNAASGLPIEIETADKDDVLAMAQHIVFALGSAPTLVYEKWNRMLPLFFALLGAATGRIRKSRVVNALQLAIEDGLLTEEVAFAPWTKENASVAERLFGVDTTITATDIGIARNGE